MLIETCRNYLPPRPPRVLRVLLPPLEPRPPRPPPRLFLGTRGDGSLRSDSDNSEDSAGVALAASFALVLALLWVSLIGCDQLRDLPVRLEELIALLLASNLSLIVDNFSFRLASALRAKKSYNWL
jgi:hypothetical protein